MLGAQVDKKDLSWFGLVRRICWALGCLFTLGYASKYARKIQKWEVLDPAYKIPGYEAFSADLSTREMGMKSSVRAKQQREWDRLSMTLSVITAASAAALAIPSPFGSPNIYWVSLACYSVAFGLSLEGIILITYLTVFAAGSSAETIGRVSRGKSLLRGLIGPVAFVVSLPTALSTYSSMYLLAGLLAMTIMKGRGEGIEEHETAYTAIVLVPVCLVLVFIVGAVIGGELIAREETKKREKRRRATQNGDGIMMPVPHPYIGQETQPTRAAGKKDITAGASEKPPLDMQL